MYTHTKKIISILFILYTLIVPHFLIHPNAITKRIPTTNNQIILGSYSNQRNLKCLSNPYHCIPYHEDFAVIKRKPHSLENRIYIHYILNLYSYLTNTTSNYIILSKRILLNKFLTSLHHFTILNT